MLLNYQRTEPFRYGTSVDVFASAIVFALLIDGSSKYYKLVIQYARCGEVNSTVPADLVRKLVYHELELSIVLYVSQSL